MLSLIIESIVFSIIMITLWMGAERLIPRLSTIVRDFIKRRRKARYNANHGRRRRKASPPAIGPSVPHFWRS
ncbi:MAG: hypothetical protein QXI81_03505 [Nitrososphaerota archaeon]